LASDDTKTIWADCTGQIADVPIPQCKDYAINHFKYDMQAIEVEIKAKYVNDARVHTVIRDAFSNLGLRFGASVSVATEGMFATAATSSSTTTPAVVADAQSSISMSRN
jgi:hypothetical protein